MNDRREDQSSPPSAYPSDADRDRSDQPDSEGPIPPAGSDRTEAERFGGSDSSSVPEQGQRGPQQDAHQLPQSDAPTNHRSGTESEPEQWKRVGRYVFDVASSVFIVLAIGGFLFAASGVWPPLVAIESGSMDPNIQKGDLVFVMEEQRFPGTGAQGGSGVVPANVGTTTDYRSFDDYGDVIVYEPYGNSQETPIIHRAMFWVEDGENWYQQADPDYRGNADSCEDLANCPAPHAGFITKGDNNPRYDQVMRLSGPVKPDWVIGTAEVRIPFLGEIRLNTGSATATN